eukprot:15189947-Ditylum_brightwellii.AAC.1
MCEVLRNVLASAAEVASAPLFVNTRKGEGLYQDPVGNGQSQPPTPVMADNFTSCDIVNKSAKQRRTQAIDMQFYWVRDRCVHKYFMVYWALCEKNIDHHTKPHPTAHCKRLHSKYLYVPQYTINGP